MTKQKKQKTKTSLIGLDKIKYSSNYNKAKFKINNLPNVSLVLER